MLLPLFGPSKYDYFGSNFWPRERDINCLAYHTVVLCTLHINVSNVCVMNNTLDLQL